MDWRYRPQEPDDDGWPEPRLWYRGWLWFFQQGPGRWRHIPGASLSATIRVEHEPGDLWLGVYRKVTRIGTMDTIRDVDTYICLIPCFPIHVHYRESRRLMDTKYSGMWRWRQRQRRKGRA